MGLRYYYFLRRRRRQGRKSYLVRGKRGSGGDQAGDVDLDRESGSRGVVITFVFIFTGRQWFLFAQKFLVCDTLAFAAASIFVPECRA